MLKRPLVFGAVLFSSGILLAVYDLNISILFTAALVICALFVFKPKAAVLCALAVLIVLSGVGRMNFERLRRDALVSEYSGKSAEMELTVTEFSENSRAVALLHDGKRRVKVYLTVKSDVQLCPGDIIKGEITLRGAIDSQTSISDFSSYLASRGVFLLASAEGVRVTGRETAGLMGKIYSLRRFMDEVGERYFSGNSRALFNAMVFGDKRLISDELSSALQASGLNHIAVVSGMHLSVIIALQMFLMHKIFGKRRIGYLLAAAGAVFITLATGAGASVVRALIMCIVFQISRLLYRENDILTSLSLAGFVMIVLNPYIIFNAGFILSLLSVLGIVLYNGKISCVLGKILPKAGADAASLSISAQLTVTPALVYYFGIITPYALISNLLVFALSTGYVIVGMVFILFSSVYPLSQLMARAMELMSLGMESVCFSIAQLPDAAMPLKEAGIGFAAMWFFILTLIYLYPAKIRKLARAAAAFALIWVCMTALHEESKIDMQFLQYGDKTLTAAELSGGSSLLIDCPDIYDAKMLENSVHPFEYAILTTSDTGQIFAQESNITTIVAPKALFDEEAEKALLSEADSMGIRVIFAEDLRRLNLSGAVIEYLPIEGVSSGKAVKIEHDTKTVITLQGLSGADIELLQLSGVRFRCDYLKLPFAAFPQGTDFGGLCTGEIIADNHLSIR